MPSIEINPQHRVEVRSIGREKTPIVVIDDLLVSTADLVDFAAREAIFSEEHVQAYPGARTRLPDAYAAAVMPRLGELVNDVYLRSGGQRLEPVQQLFSLVTRSPESLDLPQRMPHFDSNSPFYFATVHYLNPGPFGGTGIFRHRPTGFESISPERRDVFVRAAKQHIADHGEPPPAYIAGSDDHFELIGELEYRCNRLLLYPGYLLHSGLIKPDRDVGADPARKRLTANLFFMPA
jgi:hypothetical protein